MARGILLALAIVSIIFLVSATDSDSKTCAKNIRADVIFIIDGSLSVTSYNFRKYLLAFVAKFAREVKIGYNNVLVGVMVFSDEITYEIEPSADQKLKHLLRRLDEIIYPGSYSALGDALSYAADNGFGDLPKRQNTKRIVVILTDGKTNFGDSVQETAPELKKVVDRILVIGITRRIREKELLRIVKNPQDLIKLRKFSELPTIDLPKWYCSVVKPIGKCTKKSKLSLVFSIKSKVVNNFPKIWGDSTPCTTKKHKSSNLWYKNCALNNWSTGRYKMAQLELLYRGSSVLGLEFDTQATNRSNWLSNNMLRTAFPYDAEIIKKYLLFTNFENIFKICPKDYGYLGGLVKQSCSSQGMYIQQPAIVYTLSTDSRPSIFDSIRTRVADELRLYVAGYNDLPVSSIIPKKPEYHVVYRIESGSQMGAYDLYSGNLYHPVHYKNSLKITKSTGGWYKSPIIRQWPVGKFHSIRLRLYNGRQQRLAELVFNARKADRFGWFKKDLLVSSYPWKLAELQSKNYATFSLTGDATGGYSRRFLIAQRYKANSCNPYQGGILMVLDRRDKCMGWNFGLTHWAFENAAEAFLPPVIRYNVRPTRGWTRARYAHALEIAVRLI